MAERKAIEPDCKAQVDYDYERTEYGLPLHGWSGLRRDCLVMLLTDSAHPRCVAVPYDEAD